MVQSLLLIFIYLIYFRADGGNVEAALKIIKGLNSNTFNYLDSHRDELMVDKRIQVFTADAHKDGINTVKFFSICVRVNKPCVFDKLASSWPAVKLWQTGGSTNTNAQG